MKSMEEQARTKNNILSAEELRRKRLAALSNSSNNNGDDTTHTFSVSAAVNEKSTNIAAAAAAAGQEVVDLCDSSSSSDEEDLAATSTAAGRKPSARPPFLDSSKRHGENVENKQVSKRQRSAKATTATRRKNMQAGATKKATASSSTTKQQQAQATAAATTQTSTSTASSHDGATHFQVATWNVWFGAQNLRPGEPHGSARMKALARHLLKVHNNDDDDGNNKGNPLWAIGFQEVIDELAIHLFPLLESAGYQIFRQPGAPYGCALAIYTGAASSVAAGGGQHNDNKRSVHILDASWQPYSNTNMARGFLYARLQLPQQQQQLLFVTTHLESWIGKDHTGAQERVQQLQELEAFCNNQMQTYSSLQTCIVTGDMNWDDERVRKGSNNSYTDTTMASVLQTSWNDSWLTTRSGTKETCYTYDGKLNPMLSNSLRRRFDRCLVRNREERVKGGNHKFVKPTSTRLLGTEALVSLTWQKFNPYTKSYKEMPTAPSDHFGLVVQMAISK